MPKHAQKILLTDVKCRNAKSTDGILWDAKVPKMGLLVSPKGQRTFVFVSRFPGSSNPTKRTLGIYPAMSLDAARTEALRWHDLLGKGIDPGAKDDAPRAADGPVTFAYVAEQFIKRIAVGDNPERPLHRRGLVTKRRLEKFVIPYRAKDDKLCFGQRLVTEVTALHVNALIRSHVERKRPGIARNLLSIISSVCNWAIGTGEFALTISPTHYIKPAALRAVVKKRSRKFDDAELRKFWAAADEQDSCWRAFFQLALLTGVRRGELANMTWSEIDWDEKTWTIPAARMKMDRDHVVPLTPKMLEHLARIGSRRHKKGWEFVLTSEKSKGRRGLTDFNATQIRVQKRMFEMGAGDGAFTWTLHDLRRTIRSRLTELKVVHEVAESVLAHTKGAIEGTYDVSEMIDLKREALHLWEGCLLDVIAGKSWKQTRIDRGIVKSEAELEKLAKLAEAA
jgi:integrase